MIESYSSCSISNINISRNNSVHFNRTVLNNNRNICWTKPLEVHAVHPEYLACKYSSLRETAKADIKRLKTCDGKQPFLRKKSEN